MALTSSVDTVVIRKRITTDLTHRQETIATLNVPSLRSNTRAMGDGRHRFISWKLDQETDVGNDATAVEI